MPNTDPNIKVEVTGPESDMCIRLRLGAHVIDMHTRSAIDLQKKLSDAICEWTAQAMVHNLTMGKFTVPSRIMRPGEQP